MSVRLYIWDDSTGVKHQWWNNICEHVKEVKTYSILTGILAEADATFEGSYILFNTEEDKTMFLLKWA